MTKHTRPRLHVLIFIIMMWLTPASLHANSGAVSHYPEHPQDVPWPTDAWTVAAPDADVDLPRFGAAVDQAFKGNLEGTRSLVVIHRGKIIFERYADGIRPEQRQISHSTAKILTAALAGILVRQDRIDPFAPAPIAEWSKDPQDPRRNITFAQLLQMSSGLEWNENYVNMLSDLPNAMAGEGYQDQAAFVSAKPVAHEPGEYFYYSSGTTQIVSSIIRDVIGGTRDDYRKFMRTQLFDPIGMESAIPEFDAAGTFIGSSWFWAHPRDYARFGYLLLRGGEWDGRRIIDEAWLNFMRTLGPAENNVRYGAHTRIWWKEKSDAFGHAGYLGQAIVVVPSRDLVVVRSANILFEGYFAPMVDNLWAIVASFPEISY